MSTECLARTLRLALLPVLDVTRPVAAFELMTVIHLIPAVGGPIVSPARTHRVPIDPYVPVRLPTPVSGRPRITGLQRGNDFHLRRRRSDVDNDRGASNRRSGRNAACKDQRQQQTSRGSIQRAMRTFSGMSHEMNNLRSTWKSHCFDDPRVAGERPYGGAHTNLLIVRGESAPRGGNAGPRSPGGPGEATPTQGEVLAES
jgi:hypothetical protein